MCLFNFGAFRLHIEKTKNATLMVRNIQWLIFCFGHIFVFREMVIEMKDVRVSNYSGQVANIGQLMMDWHQVRICHF